MRNRVMAALAAVLIMGAAAPACSAEQPSAVPVLDIAGFDAYLAGCAKAYGIPGISFALLDGGRVVFSKGYGEASRGAPATPDTPYYLGSTSKMFTALAVLRLVERGRVELDAPYARYVPDFRLARPGAAERITVRHLLNHTSGLSDKGLTTASTGETSLEAELARMRGAVLVSEPGARFRYYNVNYRLLALLVERVSGGSFGNFVVSEVFEPLGMSSSRADDSGNPSTELIARGYGSIIGMPFARRQTYQPGALGSGYMVSSARDIAAFLQAALDVSAGGEAVGALSPRSLSTAWTAPAGVENPETGAAYGMGWMIVDSGQGRKLLYHGGAIANYQSGFFLDPERRRGFVLLMNQGGLAAQSGMSAIRDGLLRLMDGTPAGRPMRRPIAPVIAALLVFVVAAEAFRFFRLKAWRARSAGRGRARNWIGAALESAAALFIAFGLLPLGNAVSGDVLGWEMVYGLLPEAVLLVVIVVACGLAQGLYKAWTLVRQSADVQ